MLMKVTGLLDIPAEEYHADKSVVGHSALVEMMKSPKHFHHRVTTPMEPTPAMAFGTALHAAILEPQAFRSAYVVSPRFDRRTKEGKAGALQWEADNAGKTSIEQEDMDKLLAMQAAIAEHTGASELLRNGITEQSYFWTDEETGIQCRIRPDLLALDDSGEVIAMLDLKSCLDASKWKFSRTIADRGYDLQSGFYTDGLERAIGRIVPFYFLAVESGAPHGVALYKAGPKTIEAGRSKYRAALQMLEWCRRNDSYPSYQPFGESEDIDVAYFNSNLTDGL